MDLQEQVSIEEIKNVARNMQFSIELKGIALTGEGFKGFHSCTLSEMLDLIKGKEGKILNFLQDNQKDPHVEDIELLDETCVFCGQDCDENYFVYISLYKKDTVTIYDDEDEPKELIEDFVEIFKGNTYGKREENAKRFAHDLPYGAFVLLVHQCCNSWELGIQ
jgi:hypothetical protein